MVINTSPLRAAAATGDNEGSGQSAVCLDCHDDRAVTLAAGPHRVFAGAANDRATKISCTSCHNGSPAHWQDDPEAHPMSNPARQDVADAAAACTGCHQGAHQINQQTLSPHAAAKVTCAACHQIHGGTAHQQLKVEQPGLCFSCHAAVRGEFAKPSHHPIERGVIACSDCHLKNDDSMTGPSWAGTNEACLKCHPQFRGPFPHEHGATLDYSVDDGGCLNCHDPHGSVQPRLLKQPYQAPHFQLCSQCHSVPGHAFNAQHGSQWDGMACNECHVDIHGSYTNRLLLTPALRAQGCLAVGCHGGQ